MALKGRQKTTMAHWFHRNPMKPTEYVKFELKKMLTSEASGKICSELRLRREKLLELFRNAGNDLAEVDKEFNDYLRLFAGFLVDIGAAAGGGDPSKADSKLIPVVRFQWGHSMLGTAATELSDSWFEALNLIECMAMWLSKHAAWVAGKDEVKEYEAKECLSCLRRAAGMFAFVGANLRRLSGTGDFEGADFDSKVVRAYEMQAIAESQEVVVARAIEMKHNPMLISSLAAHTASLFAKAGEQLTSFKEEIFGRWRRYLQLKQHFYLAYGYAFLGEAFLKEDKCGEAVRACKEGVAEFEIAKDFASKYSTAPGPGTRIKPEEHLFFRRIKPLLLRHLEKAERENGFIYHQPVPDECPQLDSDPNYGVAKPEPFEYPTPAEIWTPAVYASFKLGKASMPDFSKIKKGKKEMKLVNEEKIYQTEKDPNNFSGCKKQGMCLDTHADIPFANLI
ncbi:BRO1 domain-containing protein BROX-like family protein [Ancylostoma ceylanicum]|uniref:BRO1 domain-containing protein BROX-like family protein n=1 Tax=Ancylostoma ceylanicum TaxID=53326 RepID=A0A0D6M5N6_9BILA|nr:BRO1 domain-containing protein BROX-like family protein [Ancylostoma ceylanicum]